MTEQFNQDELSTIAMALQSISIEVPSGRLTRDCEVLLKKVKLMFYSEQVEETRSEGSTRPYGKIHTDGSRSGGQPV
jgi:hypothetical protein